MYFLLKSHLIFLLLVSSAFRFRNFYNCFCLIILFSPKTSFKHYIRQCVPIKYIYSAFFYYFRTFLSVHRSNFVFWSLFKCLLVFWCCLDWVHLLLNLLMWSSFQVGVCTSRRVTGLVCVDSNILLVILLSSTLSIFSSNLLNLLLIVVWNLCLYILIAASNLVYCLYRLTFKLLMNFSYGFSYLVIFFI